MTITRRLTSLHKRRGTRSIGCSSERPPPVFSVWAHMLSVCVKTHRGPYSYCQCASAPLKSTSLTRFALPYMENRRQTKRRNFTPRPFVSVASLWKMTSIPLLLLQLMFSDLISSSELINVAAELKQITFLNDLSTVVNVPPTLPWHSVWKLLSLL